MAVTVFGSGNLTPSGAGTEDTLSAPAVAGAFQLKVDLAAMAAGDVLEFRAYTIPVTGGTSRVAYYIQLTGAQPTDALILTSDLVNNAITDTNAVKFTLKMVLGSTTHHFPWAVLNTQDFTNVASPTNITAGTITTVTTLTNDPGGVTTLLGRLTATRAGYLDNLSAGAVALQASLAALITTVGVAGAGLTAADDAVITAIGALNNIAAGAAMTLTSGERNSIAAALLDLADAIETGLTVRGAFRLGAAADAGNDSGMDTGSVVIKNAVANSKTRITSTVDASGNRSGTVTDVT